MINHWPNDFAGFRAQLIYLEAGEVKTGQWEVHRKFSWTVELGDKISSFYRVKDKRMTQINRAYGGQRFIIVIDRHLDCGGTFAASNYQAFYYKLNNEALLKVESYQAGMPLS